MQNTVLSLASGDLPAMAPRLSEYLARFLTFSGHELYFPPATDRHMKFLPEERLLLLPLVWRNEHLGMLRLEGVRMGEVKRILRHLPQIVSLCLENMAIARSIGIDARTGLASEESLFAHLESEAERLRESFADPSQAGARFQPLHRLCMGMLVINWPEALSVAHDFDYEFCEKVFAGMARVLKDAAPARALATCLGRFEGRHEFGLLFPATGRGACQRLAAAVMARMESLVFTDELSGGRLQPRLCAGHALYPQDMLGQEMRLPIFEQGLLLRDRARLACVFAHKSRGAIMPFAGILRHGGRILEDLGRGRVRVNLGGAANAREGMRFKVMDAAARKRKAQIVLLETHVKDSIAEVLYVDEAGRMPERGDILYLLAARERDDSLLPEACAADAGTEAPQEGAARLRLWSHSGFLAAFARESARCDRFVLGIGRMGMPDGGEPSRKSVKDFLARLELFLGDLAGDGSASSLLPGTAGRYGSNSLIFFHPYASGESVRDFYIKIASLASGFGLGLACGLFAYPFLNFSKAESEACALKALEYAALLPEPRIGVFGSLALNISADRRYSLGDAFGAIEEYKLSLLADPRNAMARNSLGVCMAALGKMEQAVKFLGEALAHCQEPDLEAKICYNLGMVYQKLDDRARARSFLSRCVRLAPDHVYAWLRLGQTSERSGRKTAAGKFYGKAAALAEKEPRLAAIAKRHLARLENAGGNGRNRSRELLHEALLNNPEDAGAMLVLAQSYLEAGEDLEVAEMLARKSAEINGLQEAWKTLADILARLGRDADAARARQRGGLA